MKIPYDHIYITRLVNVTDFGKKSIRSYEELKEVLSFLSRRKYVSYKKYLNAFKVKILDERVIVVNEERILQIDREQDA